MKQRGRKMQSTDQAEQQGEYGIYQPLGEQLVLQGGPGAH